MTTFVQIIVMVKANQSLGMATMVTVWMLVVVEVAAEAGEADHLTAVVKHPQLNLLK